MPFDNVKRGSRRGDWHAKMESTVDEHRVSAEFVGAGHAGNARMLTRHPKTVEAEVDGDGVMRGPAVTVMNSSIFDATSVSGSSTGPARRTEKQSAPRYVPHSSRTSHGDGWRRMPVPRSRSHLLFF